MQRRAFTDEAAKKPRDEDMASGIPKTTLLDEQAPFIEWAAVIKQRMMEKLSFRNMKPKTIEKEIEHFIMFGNCGESDEFKPATCNITLLTTEFLSLQFYYLACPFDSYFPVPFEDQEHPLLHFSAYNNAYYYCKAKLQQLVTELRKHKNRVTFHFHANNFFQLDSFVVKMENKFQIVHFFGTADAVGIG